MLSIEYSCRAHIAPLWHIHTVQALFIVLVYAFCKQNWEHIEWLQASLELKKVLELRMEYLFCFIVFVQERPKCYRDILKW